MIDPNIKTKVVHSKSKPAWNVIGVELGKKYKIARVPYAATPNPDALDAARAEAKIHADFICACFNDSEAIAHRQRSLAAQKRVA